MNKQVAALTARMVLEAGAVQYAAERPFFLSSGWASPVYIDCQRLISFPRIREKLMDLAAQTVLGRVGYEQFDVVAGVESSGIAYSAWIAERLSLPLLYVRRKPLGFGREALIEGALPPGRRVLLVDDVTTDGRTKIDRVRALRGIEARADHVLVMFFFDVFPETVRLLSELKISLHYLASWKHILEAARASGYFDRAAADDVQGFLDAPARWSLEHGGIGAFPGQ
jgi:orotate phosphoribosyltransferase